jgi:hypothetical protein
MRSAHLAFLVALAAVAACAGEPAVGSSGPTGIYPLTIQNGANGCHFAVWTEGQSLGASLGITRDLESRAITGQLDGLPLDWLLMLGPTGMAGMFIDGEVTLRLTGSRDVVDGDCTYRVIVDLHGTLEGELLAGEMTWTIATGGAPECASLAGCASQQAFSGMRRGSTGDP